MPPPPIQPVTASEELYACGRVGGVGAAAAAASIAIDWSSIASKMRL